MREIMRRSKLKGYATTKMTPANRRTKDHSRRSLNLGPFAFDLLLKGFAHLAFAFSWRMEMAFWKSMRSSSVQAAQWSPFATSP